MRIKPPTPPHLLGNNVEVGGILLTPDMQDAYDTLTPLQRDIALSRLCGATLAESYDSAGGMATTKSEKQHAAYQILNLPDVKKFIQAVTGHQLSHGLADRCQTLEILSSILRGEDQDAKTADRLKAAKQLADMQGWNVATKHEVAVTENKAYSQMTNDEFKEALAGLGINA